MNELLNVLSQELLPSANLNGGSVIDANNDSEAVIAWLRAKGGRSAKTFDSYRRESVRLLLWLNEQHLSLNEMKVDHVHLFFKHLANPPQNWIRPVKTRRGETLLPTQVLAGQLSSQSINYARTVLSQMFSYLQDAGYLQRNAFRLSTQPSVMIKTVQTRMLDIESWQWLWRWIQSLPRNNALENAHATRTRWLFALLYHTGIRREEAAKGRMGDFVRKGKSWSLRVIGKGNKERFVSINSALLQELMYYRNALGLDDYPIPSEECPLVTSINKTRRSKPLTPRAISLIIYTVGKMAANACTDPHIRLLIMHMTTHWMRHTNATHRLIAGASLETTQDELGHADPKTTRIYAKTTNTKRQEDAEKLANL